MELELGGCIQIHALRRPVTPGLYCKQTQHAKPESTGRAFGREGTGKLFDITSDGLEYTVKELLKANAMVCKQRDEARNAALEEACGVVYGMAGSDNAAQRTVNAIRKLKKEAEK